MGFQGRKEVFQELKKDHPTIKLLYTTPEQLQNSTGLVECLQDLSARYACVVTFDTGSEYWTALNIGNAKHWQGTQKPEKYT